MENNKITENIKIPCEIYSRVVGYFRPLSQWHPGKQEEFRIRLNYKIELEKESGN